MDYKLYHGDCLEEMDKLIQENIKVDAIIADIPFGITACKFDNIIPFDEMWKRLNKITNEQSPIVLFGTEPFSSALRMSNIKHYKYDWTWIKNQATNHFHAKRMPLRKTENISVFFKKSSWYNPQKTTGHIPTNSAKGVSDGKVYHGTNTRNYDGGDTTRMPLNIINFDCVGNYSKIHPNEKPIKLMEYLIKTYTNENETVLDFTSGSNSTGIACQNTNRSFIGIEKDDKYFEIGKNRMDENNLTIIFQ